MSSTPSDRPRDPAALLSAVGELASSSEPTDYGKLGYHHRHTASQSDLPAIAGQFFAAGYILEMITCQDRRDDLQAMRLVYTFNHLGTCDRHLIHADVPATTLSPDDVDTVADVDTSADSADAQTGPGGPLGSAGERHPIDPRDAICYGIDAEAVSLAAIYPAADWFEREVYDMYGVRFLGHPNLRRILLPEDAEFHALLKDFGRMEDAPKPEDSADPS